MQSLGEALGFELGDQDSEEKARRKVLRKFEPSRSRIACITLNRIDYLQKIDQDYRKPQAAFQRKWVYEVS